MSKPQYTTEDIFALREGKNAELIDGKLYPTELPTLTHQEIVVGLGHALYKYIANNDENKEVFFVPLGVFLFDDNLNYFVPDLFVCEKSRLTEDGCHGAPDIIIEVTSENTEQLDYMLKFTKFWEAGVKEYWIVNPRIRQVSVFYFDGITDKDMVGDNVVTDDDAENAVTVMHSFDEEISFYLYPDLTVRVADYV